MCPFQNFSPISQVEQLNYWTTLHLKRNTQSLENCPLSSILAGTMKEAVETAHHIWSSTWWPVHLWKQRIFLSKPLFTGNALNILLWSINSIGFTKSIWPLFLSGICDPVEKICTTARLYCICTYTAFHFSNAINALKTRVSMWFLASWAYNHFWLCFYFCITTIRESPVW